ncbi:uncharacterized protein K444DRAFT_546524 [Hyaloscypha bicolor E]|uniref:Uncharacterized protein n=1 Tax=Hyaloscypha bicolor E TaxID=1095630 RepID=A0A2J6SIY8_9HELO|nr:uncharacterized protein K444DRAFT_546524 [Hyaloscypha bicolor E]PMD50742.1 hypothetical protein K444DRAFT_546524 [Hyaloscypha bicolor E]
MAPPNTRPPSRPPITSRIRSSFEKRRKSNEVQSPTYTNGNSNPFITQDPESFRKAIDEAINSETFQDAIAANLAKLIKPSIKTALDTIQPVVEAVYNHEVLLNKANRSVENILDRLESNTEAYAHQRDSVTAPPAEPAPPVIQERAVGTSTPSPDFAQFKQLLGEINARTSASLTGLSSSVEASNGKIAEALHGISNIQATLGPTKENIDALKVFSEQSTTTASVMQAQLDQLKADVGQIMDAIGTNLGKNVQALHEKAAGQDTSLLSSHTTKLDAIATDLGALKGHSDTMGKIEAISAELTGLKGSVDAGISSNTACFTSLGSQITNVLNTMEGHTSTLGEIKDRGAHPDILAALQQSNDSHAAHATALGEMKERSLAAAPAAAPVSEGSSDTTAVLQDLKADLASLKENIAAGLAANNENATGLGAKIDTVLTTVEAHKAADASPEILAAVQQSNESHASHATALDGIKSLAAGPAPPAETGNLAALEAQVGSIVGVLDVHTAALDEIKTASSAHATALEAHTAALDEIKTASSSHATALEAHAAALGEIKTAGTDTAVVPTSNSDALEGHLSTIIETLDAHTNLLNEIKDDVGAEILTTLHGLGQSQTQHGDMLAEIREADVSDEILTLLHAHGESHTGHGATLGQIHESVQTLNASHAAHGAALEEIKSRSAHSSHIATLADIKEATTASNEAHTSHAAALDELKTAQSASAAIASRSESPDIAGLETQLNNIIITLERQTATLSSLKDSALDNSISEAVLGSHDLLISHTTLLNAIKDNSSHEDIVSNISDLKALVAESKSGIDEHSTLVRDLHSDTKEAHSNLTSAIAGLALGGAAGAGAGALMSHESDNSSTEILTEVKSVKEKVDFVVSQLEINHTTVTTRITTLSDELKAEIDATGTQITESITKMDTDLKSFEIDLKPITSAVEHTGLVVKDLSSQIGNLESHISDNTSKVNEIHQGVHLNDTGISQLQEHAGTREVVSQAVPEGMWFGSGSPSAKRLSNPFEHSSVPVEEPEAEEPEVEEEQKEHGQALEAIPEVDTPLEESPSAPVEPEIPHQDAEEESTPVEPEISHQDVEVESTPIEPEASDQDTKEECTPVEPEASHQDMEVEGIPIEPEVSHHDVEEESTPVEPEVPRQDTEEESAPVEPEIPHQDAEEESAPVEPKVSHQDIEEESAPPEIVEEPAKASPDPEISHDIPEPEPASEPHEKGAEPELAPEHDPDHQIPESTALEEHHTAPEPDHLHEAADLDESSFSQSAPHHPLPAEEPELPLTTSHDQEPTEHDHADPEPTPPTSPLENEPVPVLSPSTQTNPFSDPEEEDLESASASASTSAIASPMSGSFTEHAEGGGASKGGKKKKKKKKGKKDKKKGEEKVPLVMDGQDPVEGAE